jgi:hypothetical protein
LTLFPDHRGICSETQEVRDESETNVGNNGGALPIGVLIVSCKSADSETESAVLEELLAQEKAVLDPYFGESDPSSYVARYADRVTYFDAWSPVKLENDAARDHLLAFKGEIPPFNYEIVNPSVQLMGDTAIFTLQVDMIDPAAGETFALWSTTEVHCRADDGWELVHAHWSFAIPPPPEA